MVVVDDVGVVAEEPERWGIGFPPEDCCRDSVRFWEVGVERARCAGDDGWDCELGRHDAALVVDAHQEPHGCIEDHPCRQQHAGLVQAEAAEEEGYAWE